MSDARLLEDADLAELEDRCRRQAEADGRQEPPFVSAKLALRLVAELRRLRAAQSAPGQVPTDNELQNLRDHFERMPDMEPLHATSAGEVIRVLDALRRLRSDEWLRAAVDEIADDDAVVIDPTDGHYVAEPKYFLAILRKHRDGKA